MLAREALQSLMSNAQVRIEMFLEARGKALTDEDADLWAEFLAWIQEEDQ
jgi:hypothetical protein